jgi:hypothetical protein
MVQTKELKAKFPLSPRLLKEPENYPYKYLLAHIFENLPPTTQRKLKDDLQQLLGIKNRTLYHYRAIPKGSEHSLSADQLWKLCKFFGVDMAQLVAKDAIC